MFLFSFLAFITVSLSSNDAYPIDELSLKIAYIERFTKFIEWPQTSSETFTIQVVGNNDMYKAMQDQFKNHSIKNKKTDVISSFEINKESPPQVLIIGNIRRINDILDQIKNKPILTISSGELMCEKGVMINLFINANRLRFEINEIAIRESGLYVNYRLMQMAMRIIYPLKNEMD